MKKPNHCVAVGAALGMFVLIFDGSTALNGAREGIILCLSTLIPSLYPFIFLSNLLTGALSGQELGVLRPVTKFCKMPAGSESLLAVGFLGGYPVGAQCVCLLKMQGQLSDTDASRALAFCNNAGPSFIFGILSSMFSDWKAPCLLWIVHIVSALFVGVLIPTASERSHIKLQKQKENLMQSFNQALKAMASICGWVILMRMVLAFMESWFLWLLPLPMQVAAEGLLELSNGCIRLSELPCEGLRFLIASGLLSLGGICVMLQTRSVADGISLRLYFPGKIIQCAISILISSLLQVFFPTSERYNCSGVALIALIALVFAELFLKHSEKNSRIPAGVSV